MREDLELPGGRAGPSLSVVGLWRAGTVLLFLFVILHAFQSLASKVLKHNVVVAGGKDKENGCVCRAGRVGLSRGWRACTARWDPEAGLWDWPRIERPARLAHLNAHQ